MVKHVVMWKMKENAEGNDKQQNIELATNRLLALKDVISAIDSIEIGKNFNGSDAAQDLVLISTHADKDALQEYAQHPAHQEVAAFIGSIVASRTVVDFEY